MSANSVSDLALLRRCIRIAQAARDSGNTPFGALLADPQGRVLLEQGNVELTEHRCTGHAETALMELASRTYPPDFLAMCSLYTSVEPCAMCAGAIYWGNVGRVVYALDESRLATLTGDDERNLTLALPCRAVFAAGRKTIEVAGPFAELEAEVMAGHAGFWQ